MTLIQRISLYMAKRYLKTHHFRLRGFADDTIYGAGDVLMSPNALRYFKALNHATTFEWDMEEVKGKFKGMSPPLKRKQTV